VTQVGIAKRFRADLAGLPGPIARKAAVWPTDFMLDPDDARLEAHRAERALMPNLWTAKLDASYRFFVGMTRARDHLLVTWSGEPSEFLTPPER
jgi:hypothetical protein